ncbi:uncharacterized protein LOC134716517 [Mytilus trossulus]|uniref:uncharacterized protein LOC134716517 n=1 Tax=Mytilus trossulus TaxID=6551 RepID=UPI0030071A5D
MHWHGQYYKIAIFIIKETYVWTTVIVLAFLCALNVDGLKSDVPYFEPRENNVSFHTGSTATLMCSIIGLQTRIVVWRRMSEPSPLTIGDFVYSQDSRISIRRVVKQNEWNLIIKDVRPADAGVYECAVSSREKYKRLVLLRVTGTYSNLSRKSYSYENDILLSQPQVNVTGNDFVSKGQTILLTCNATGEDHAPDTVDWFINGLKVDKKNMPRVRVYNKVDIYRRTLLSTLEIRRSLMSDAGVYICRGPDEKNSKLTVHILDEEKSIIDKRGDFLPSSEHGFVNDSSAASYLFQWTAKCLVSCVFATWFTHIWFIT